MAFHLLQNLVRAALVLVFEIENRVDEVFALQRPQAVLPAKAREDRAVVECGLSIEVQLGSPPGGGTVFKLGPEGVEVVARALGAERREVLYFKAAGFFEIVIIGNEIGPFLSQSRRSRKKSNKAGDQEGQKGFTKAHAERFSLQMICNNEIRLAQSAILCNLFATVSPPTVTPSSQPSRPKSCRFTARRKGRCPLLL